MTSIRRALTLRLLCTLGAMMIAVAGALYLGVRAALVAQFDGTLRARLATVESATRWDGRRVDLDYVAEAMPWYRPGPDAEYFEVLAPDGAGATSLLVARSESLGLAVLDISAKDDPVVVDARLPDGRPGRVATELFKPPPEEDLDAPGRELERSQAVATTPAIRVTVAMSRAGLDASLRTIAVGLVSASLVMGLGLVLGVRLALVRGLAPIRRLSAQVEQVGADTLSARLTGDDLPAELRPMQVRINELIERLEIAFARERRFASAAAHELRTPVAELRALLEVSASRPREVESVQETVAEALEITIRMESLVRSLLTLARHPTRSEASQQPACPLGPVLLRVTRRLELRVHAAGGTLECVGADAFTVNADPAALESVLSNILTNAVEYSRPVPNIRCEVQTDGPGRVRVDVTNPVREISRQEVARFFEPFWRKSESRTDQSHLGLGLAVARTLASGMGAELSAELQGEDTVRVRLVLCGSEREPGAVNSPAISIAGAANQDLASAASR